MDRVMIPTDSGEMPGLLFLPESGRGPGIVLHQEIFGLSDFLRQRAQDLADLGYVVLAPQFYWRIGADRVAEDRPDYLSAGMGLMQQFDWPSGVADGVAAMDWLARRDEVDGGRVGLVGYCFGGGLAFNVAAESDPVCLVAYYGSALPQLLDLAPRVTCPTLHIFGKADSYIPLETQAQIQQAVTAHNDQVTWRSYDGAEHAFDNPLPAFHNAEASAEAWLETQSFLGTHLPVA